MCECLVLKVNLEVCTRHLLHDPSIKLLHSQW